MQKVIYGFKGEGNMDSDVRYGNWGKKDNFERDIAPIDSTAIVSLEDDFLSAKLTLTPPQHGGLTLSERDILYSIAASGITRGINKEVLKNLAENPIYQKSVVIAEAKKPVNGLDGKLSYSLTAPEDLIVPIEEFGNSFIDSRMVRMVKKGHVICEILPPTKGEAGYNLLGKVLPANDGVPVPNPIGQNVRLSQDKTKVIANCDGHVVTKNNKVSVSDCVIVDELNAETGGITCESTVIIRGDVKEHVVVKAEQDIIVCGNAENVTLMAGCCIWLFKGITGKDSSLSAGGNITTALLENVIVKAHGNIYADKIFSSKINCEGSVKLYGEQGSIIGGVCEVEENFCAKQVGNKANVLTRINIVGPSSMEHEQRITRLKLSEAKKTKEKLEILIKSLGTYVGMSKEKRRETVVRSLISKKNLEAEIEILEERMKVLRERLSAGIIGQITIKGKIYNNVVLDIDDSIFKNTLERGSCVFYKNQGKIAMKNMGKR